MARSRNLVAREPHPLVCELDRLLPLAIGGCGVRIAGEEEVHEPRLHAAGLQPVKVRESVCVLIERARPRIDVERTADAALRPRERPLDLVTRGRALLRSD